MGMLSQYKKNLEISKIGAIKQLNLSICVAILYLLLISSSVFFLQTYKIPLPAINIFSGIFLAGLILSTFVFPIFLITSLVVSFLKKKSSSRLSYVLALLVYLVLIVQSSVYPFRNIYINSEKIKFLLNEGDYISELNKIKPDTNGKKYYEFDEQSIDGSFVLYDDSDNILNSKSKSEGVFWSSWGSRNDSSGGRCIVEVIPLKSHFYFVGINASQC